MQDKLYKRSTLLIGVILLINIGAIVWLFLNKDVWADKKTIVSVCFVLFMLASMLFYAYIDLNADRNYIRKAVRNGDVVMAKIKAGSFIRIARDARLRKHIYWKIDATLYDDDMNPHEITIVEKFATSQTSIPSGHVYITYDKNNLDNSLIIPNVIISSIPEYQFLVETYEKEIHPKYLNAYYRNGLVLQSYKDSIKEEKEIRKAMQQQ
ncbi:MAG: hypothetical protein Q4E33_05660 [Erysipelotrichaceae bacterium]|nr:hypothetical protein [Erysipelotrichaceae bacterium]